MSEKPTAPERITIEREKAGGKSGFWHQPMYGDPDPENEVTYIRADLAHPADPGMPEQEWRERVSTLIAVVASQYGIYGRDKTQESIDIARRAQRELGELIARRVSVDRDAIRNAAQCTLGVGCDEAGVCYAIANNRPDMCPKISICAPKTEQKS